jgi:hypothetical protein
VETEAGDGGVPDHYDPAHRSIMGLALSDWGATVRLVVLLSVAVLVVGLAIGLLHVDVVVGPVQVTRHT